MYLRELSTICLKPLRIAFDHLGLKGPYEKAIRYAHEFGLTELSNYMLYNFHDTPADLFERMRLNVTLNEELGVRIWSFPMRYQPTDRPDRGHIGEKWTRYQLRSVQTVLQATHGVVSGEPEFFKRAFGDEPSDFNRILLLPNDYIFNRDWYERFDGRPEFEDYTRHAKKLNEADKGRIAPQRFYLPAIRETSRTSQGKPTAPGFMRFFLSMCQSLRPNSSGSGDGKRRWSGCHLSAPADWLRTSS